MNLNFACIPNRESRCAANSCLGVSPLVNVLRDTRCVPNSHLQSSRIKIRSMRCALEEEINLSRLERAVHSACATTTTSSYKLLALRHSQVPFLCLRSALQTLPILIWPCLLVYSAHIKNAPAFALGSPPASIQPPPALMFFFRKIERKEKF